MSATLHIAFNMSAAGTIRSALGPRGEGAVVMSPMDDLATGWLRDDRESFAETRRRWWRDVLAATDDAAPLLE